MKVVIFSGGTGSIALQKGFNEHKSINVQVVINAYDNGLSTGAVRKVLDGKILGPSDLRKNQLLQAELQNTCEKDLLSFLNDRTTVKSSEEMYSYIMNRFKNLDLKSISKRNFLQSLIDSYFKSPNRDLISYDDFSISNIIYAGAAKIYDYSLERAGIHIASKLLNLSPDSTTLVSDDSLFLQAVTETGKVILDEGDIVKWNNPKDPIVSIKLVDVNGVSKKPAVSKHVIDKINDAED